MKALVTTALLAIVLAASLLVVVPSISMVYVDWAHPNRVEWRQENGRPVYSDEGKREVSVDYTDNLNVTMGNLYDSIDPPWRPGLTEIIIASIGLGILFVVASKIAAEFFTEQKHGHYLIIGGVLQLVVWMLCWAVGFATDHNTNFTGHLSNTVNDPQLVKIAVEASKDYYGMQAVGPMLLSVASIAMLDTIVLASYGLLYLSVKPIGEKLRWALSNAVGNYMRGNTLVSFRSDSVEVLRLRPQMRFGFLPVLHGEIINRVSFQRFFDLITSRSRAEINRGLCRKVVEAFRGRRNEICPQTFTALAESITTRAGQDLIPQLRQAQNGQNNGPLGEALQLLQRTSDTTLGRFQQDVVAGIDGVTDEALARFRRTVRERIVTTLFGGIPGAESTGQEDVYPEGVRFLFSKGDTTIVVVEEKPQVRTVLFSDDFLGYEESDGDREGLRLAFPYVVFIIRFIEGYLEDLYVFYRNSPLTSLDDTLHRPNLPNTYADCRVCTWSDYVCEHYASLSQRVEQIISGFWQSRFNNHESGINYVPSTGIDSRLRNVSAWEEASKADPLFVLRIPWLTAKGSLRDLVSKLSQQETETTAAKLDRILREAFDSGMEEVMQPVRRYCANIKVEGRYPRTVGEELVRALQATKQQMLSTLRNQLSTLLDNTDPGLTKMVETEVARVVEDILAEEFDRDEVFQLYPRIDTSELSYQLETAR